jgi:putative ATP-binding cassette transporter
VRHGFPAVGDRPAYATLGPVDLTIRRGEILFIVGKSGSGETTLIKLILGLHPPMAATVLPDSTP